MKKTPEGQSPLFLLPPVAETAHLRPDGSRIRKPQKGGGERGATVLPEARPMTEEERAKAREAYQESLADGTHYTQR